MKHQQLLDIIKECTTSASIASVPANTGKILKREGGAIGVGFDPNGDWGIYEKPKNSKKDKK